MKITGIDLFCGAGGVTTGIESAIGFDGNKAAEVSACVNHDEMAIESHRSNHLHAIHYVEDIRELDEKLLPHKKLFQGNVSFLWASLECTNFSNAKGGLPRDADSRTLAWELYRYIEELSPDYVMVENVMEFMAWGELDEKGKPIEKLKGTDYVDWRDKIKSYGYSYEWRKLNAADYGAYTSRRRYFGMFAKKHLPIVWPEPTHDKNGVGGLPKWRAVREVLNLDQRGQSIFTRKKPLVENTLKRIYDGLEKFVAGGKSNLEKDAPAFFQVYYGNGWAHSLDEPAPTLTTKDRLSLIQPQLMDYQCSKSKPRPLILNYNSSTSPMKSSDEPSPTITTSRTPGVVTPVFLMNPQFSSKGSSLSDPCFTLIAKMDKRPPYLIETEEGVGIEVYEDDSPMTVKIKHFMACYGIADIKMRLLTIPELLRIQGFPEDYKLRGTQAQQKKFIGNSVVPIIPQKWFESIYSAINSQVALGISA